MIGIWHEIKKLVKDEEQRQESIGPDELVETASKKSTEAFFLQFPPILDRWMKC